MLTMPTEQKSSGNEIYQIKVTLLRTVPPVWRRLLVPSDITLSNLHDLLQLAMGWTDSHLHEFLFRGQCYGPTGPERRVAEAIDERKVRLNQLLVRVGAKIVYVRLRRRLGAWHSPRKGFAGRPKHGLSGGHGRS